MQFLRIYRVVDSYTIDARKLTIEREVDALSNFWGYTTFAELIFQHVY